MFAKYACSLVALSGLLLPVFSRAVTEIAERHHAHRLIYRFE